MTRVWADGFGLWHVALPDDGSSEQAQRTRARRIIADQVRQREDNPAPVIRLGPTRGAHNGVRVWSEA